MTGQKCLAMAPQIMSATVCRGGPTLSISSVSSIIDGIQGWFRIQKSEQATLHYLDLEHPKFDGVSNASGHWRTWFQTSGVGIAEQLSTQATIAVLPYSLRNHLNPLQRCAESLMQHCTSAGVLMRLLRSELRGEPHISRASHRLASGLSRRARETEQFTC